MSLNNKNNNKEINSYTLIHRSDEARGSHLFATGIKTESSDQSTFGGADQGIKVTSKLLKTNN